jgi:virginiamycin B lyase
MAPNGAITEFPLAPGSQPFDLATGVDGAVWFTEFGRDMVGRITRDGTIREFPVPGGGAPQSITVGPDRALWFSMGNGDKIGRITTQGMLKQFDIPSVSFPNDITTGSDGNIWFAEGDANKIVKMLPTPPFTMTEYQVPTGNSNPVGLAAGTDGNLWFAEQAGNKIGRLTTDGSFTEFPVPTLSSFPLYLSAGPDGNMWFTEFNKAKVGRILVLAPNTITEFSTPSAGSCPDQIVPGPDANLWLTEACSHKIARMTLTGSFTEFAIPTPTSHPEGITQGPDGNIWFAEFQGNKIGRLDQAVVGVSYGLVQSFSYAPTKVVLSAQGDTIQWTFLGAVNHTVTDSSGMGLFDSGSRSFVSYYTFMFTAAGKYPYLCSIHPTVMSGASSVPIEVPASGSVGVPFTVTWSSAPPPTADYVFDVQIKGPGFSSWTDWQSGVSSTSADYTPSVSGRFGFRARLRNMTIGASSLYSIPGSVLVT